MDDILVIDLTDTYIVNHNGMSDSIIEIDDTDESISEESDTKKKNYSRTPMKSSKLLVKKNASKAPESPAFKIGECPICCERLGKKAVSSTKCGHVFCLPCIKTAFKHNNRCPQCRTVLRGSPKFHRIYLPLERE